MKVVGERLSHWAISESDEINVDLFGRSAFNRYYYSAFLITRNLLKQLDPKWETSAHKAIPDILRTSLAKRVKQSIRNAKRQRLLNESEASSIQTRFNNAIAELSSLLEASYSVRVTADYEPEIKVDSTNSHLKLENTTLEAANNWPDRASMHCGTILGICREIGLA